MIRQFEMKDEDSVLSLWGRCLTSDPVTPELFREKIPLERDFDPDWCLVSAEDGGKVLGFIYSPATEKQAFVNVIFVDPIHRGKGIGTSLLQKALEIHVKAGRRSVMVSGGPRYFFPGVDVEAYGRAIDFFSKNGFVELNRNSLSMGRSLVGYRIPDQILDIQGHLEEEIFIKYLEPRYILGLRFFLREHFPEWEEVARETLERNPMELDLFVVAIRGEEVVGCCQCASDGLLEHFGPFGVREDMRGKGIGAVLFHRCLQRIQAKGCKNVWFTWGGGRNYSFYTRHGMAVTRRFATMKIDLSS